MSAAELLRCSFCREPHHAVPNMIAGPGVNICGGCVRLAVEVLAEQGVTVPRAREAFPPQDMAADPRVLDLMLRSRIEQWAERPADERIGPESNPYMLRWYLRQDRERGHVYLHHFLRSDDDRALHDHPWPFSSLILDGAYREITPEGDTVAKPGDLVLRHRPELPHRIELLSSNVTTLVITGPKEREWGFHCPRGWVSWQDFGVRGCG